MSLRPNITLSDIRMMILCEFPLSTEEIGHQYYDGEGVKKSLKEAYVWYRIAQCAGNHSVDSLVDYIGTTLTKSTYCKLSSKAKHIYTQALQR